MRIIIKETGEVKKLCLNKVLFNGMWDTHRAEEEDYDVGKKTYSMTEDTFRWWEDYIAREEELSFREREYGGLNWTDYEVIRRLLFKKGEADPPLPLFSLFLSGQLPIFYTIYLEALSDLHNAKCLILDDLDRMTKENKNIVVMFPKENMCHEEIVETTKRHLENIYREKITETEFYEMYEQGLIKCGETTIVVLGKGV
jgi:hypothetical protein